MSGMHSGISVILAAEHVGSVFGFPVTNALVMTWIVMALLIGFAFFFGRSLTMVPGKLQAGIEWLFSFALDYMAEVLENRELAERFFPLVASIFLFILVCNELEFFPGVGSIGFVHGGALVPLLRTPAADLNFTLALTLIVFIAIEATGIAMLGVFKYAGRFFNFSSPLKFAIGLIELVSELARLLSFSFRLFGNIFAGEVLVLVIGSFVSYLLPTPFIAFELFVGIIQASILTLLTLFFTKIAIEEEEAHEEIVAEELAEGGSAHPA